MFFLPSVNLHFSVTEEKISRSMCLSLITLHCFSYFIYLEKLAQIYSLERRQKIWIKCSSADSNCNIHDL